MSRKYYLVDKEIIDSWINYIERFPLYPEDKEHLQSLTQQSELVEVKEIVDVVKAEYVKNDTKGSFLKWLEEVKSYKIIKNIK
jgi:hypothetical protein